MRGGGDWVGEHVNGCWSGRNFTSTRSCKTPGGLCGRFALWLVFPLFNFVYIISLCMRGASGFVGTQVDVIDAQRAACVGVLCMVIQWYHLSYGRMRHLVENEHSGREFQRIKITRV